MKLHLSPLFLCAAWLLLSLWGCHQRGVVPKELLLIDSLCETEPRKAMSMLDSLSERYGDAHDDAYYKYRLLCIKAKDKAYCPIGGEKQVTDVVRHYKATGERMSLIEAYYYQGGYYRDNDDNAKAIESYKNAIDVAEKDSSLARSVPIACCYGQLSGLFMKLSQMDRMLAYAKKEHEIFSFHTPDDIVKELDMARAYRNCEKKDSAEIFYRNALSLILAEGVSRHPGELAEVLFFYTMRGNRVMADSCYKLLKLYAGDNGPANVWGALGEYHKCYGSTDTARYYMELQFEKPRNWVDRKNCAHDLFEYYRKRGELEKAVTYASAYDEACDSIEVQNRREAAIGRDKFLRYLEGTEKNAQIQEVQRMTRLFIPLLVGVCAVFTLLLFIVIRGEKRKIIGMEQQLERRSRLLQKNMMTTMELHSIFKHAVTDKEILKNGEVWKKLLLTVDYEKPDFAQKIDRARERLSTDELRLLYLLQIGLRKKEIAAILDTSPSTVTRKLKVVEEALL